VAFNPSGAVGVPLTVLGGWVTEMAPTALPEGVSPDNQELMYLPGSAYSRGGFEKVFENPFPSGGPNNLSPTVVYGKSFVTSSGVIKNLYFDSNGVMWVEDWSNSPGTYTKLFQSTPGSFCKSVTAFGREWIAISDGLHGSDISYQWDGTNLQRVTQDGPGVCAQVSSLAPAPQDLIGTAVGLSATIATATYADPQFLNGHLIGYLSIEYTVTTPEAFTEGMIVSVSGNSYAPFNVVSVRITQIISSTQFKIANIAFSLTPATGTGGTATQNIYSLTRAGNLVTGNTVASTGVQVGNQIQISGVSATPIGGGIVSIVIENDSLPGLATVTTTDPHGLGPNQDVTITGVTPETIGSAAGWTGIRQGDVVTLVNGGGAHGLVPGAVVQVSGATPASFNTSVTVALVPAPDQIVYEQVDADATATGVTVSLAWPVPDNTPTPTYFEVVTAPTPTTFTVQVTYSDGTWTSGAVSFAWNGTFYVNSINAQTFTYTQYGPDATSTDVGSAIVYGQCSPGLHLMQTLFLLQDGTITAPSPPVSFIANGGQLVNVSNIPTGPSDVKARILAFTGAQPNVPGLLPPFFYLPVPAQLEGQIVSTATQINDNTTMGAILDFSDNSLFAAIGISITGNNLADQIKIDGALGFGYWESRLTTWGQRNAIQNFINMGFGGGTTIGAVAPAGWTLPASSVHGSLSLNVWDGTWTIAAQSTDIVGTSGLIQQSAYLDPYGDPILDPLTTYKVRFKVASVTGIAANISIIFFLTDGTFTTTATVPGSNITTWQATNGGYFEATFLAATPITIQPTLEFGLYAIASAGTVTVALKEISVIDAEEPYLDTQSFTSYTNNPSGFDGVSGNMQPTEDTRKIMDYSVIRGSLYCHTQDPSGRLHEITVDPTSEPVGWIWREVAANCGTLSAFGVTHSQADDESVSGAQDWCAWPAESGAMIFDGGVPEKISQEIQPNWNAPYSSFPWVAAGSSINMAAATNISALNDPVERILYFFLPVGSATTPNRIYPLSYRELNSAYAIAGSPPFHPSLGGKLIATDNTRKWTRCMRAMNGAARMYRDNLGQLTTVFFGGNGQALGVSAGYGNIYILNPAKLTDDDYGQISPYYITAPFLDPEKAQAIGLAFVRLLCAYANIFIAGVGTVTYTCLCDALTNTWNLTTTRNLSTTPTFDQEFAGNQAQGNRIFLKIASAPLTGQTDNSFNLQRVQLWFKKAKLQIRGAAA